MSVQTPTPGDAAAGVRSISGWSPGRGADAGGSTRGPVWWLFVGSPSVLLALTVVAVLLGLARGPQGLVTAVLHDGVSFGSVGGPLLVGSLLVGLPHGAVDLARLEGSARHRAAATAWYLGLTGTAAGAWLLAPLPTLLVLLALAVAHFGAGDADVDDTRNLPARRWFTTGHVQATGWRRGAGRWLLVSAAGGVPVLVPLGLHGTAVTGVLNGLSAGRGEMVVIVCRALLPGLAVVVAVAVVICVRAQQWVAVFDLCVLVVAFVVLTPLVAFAAYFGLWHSFRQTVLLLAGDMTRYGLGWRAALVRLARQSLPPVAITVTVLTVLLEAGGVSVIAYLLAAVLCLTLPHAAAGVAEGRRCRRRSI